MAITKNGNAPITTNSPDTTGWVEEKLGFDPYWKPEEGKAFVAIFGGVDDRDPDFIRYSFVAGQDGIQCQTGPADDDNIVVVNKGEPFNISAYAQLGKVFEKYIALDVKPIVRIEAVEEINIAAKKGHTFWSFKMTVHPDSAKALAAAKNKHIAGLVANRDERKALQGEA